VGLSVAPALVQRLTLEQHAAAAQGLTLAPRLLLFV